MVSKAVKLPVELIERIKENETGVTPGEALLTSYDEFVKLRDLAGVLCDIQGDGHGASVSDTIISHIKEENTKYEAFDKALNELSAMVNGLSIFFKKFGGK